MTCSATWPRHHTRHRGAPTPGSPAERESARISSWQISSKRLTKIAGDPQAENIRDLSILRVPTAPGRTLAGDRRPPAPAAYRAAVAEAIDLERRAVDGGRGRIR